VTLDLDVDGIFGDSGDGAGEGALFDMFFPPCGGRFLHVIVKNPDLGDAAVEIDGGSDFEVSGEELTVFGGLEPESVDAEEFGVAFVEGRHAGVGVAALGHPEVKRAFWFGKIVDLEFDSIGIGVWELGEETFGFRHLIKFGDGGFNVTEGCVGVRIGPTGVAVCDHFSGRRCDKDALVDAVWIVGKYLGCDPVFPDLFVGIFVVADVVCGDGN
jgi:hypothetical protein